MGKKEGQEGDEEAQAQGAEGDGVGGADVVGFRERDEDGGERGGGAGEAARRGLRPLEQLPRKGREAAERGVDVAGGEHQTKRLRRWGIRGE